MMNKILRLSGLLLALAAWTPPHPVPQIANPNLNDIAAATMTAQGPVIVYNPAAVQNAPESFREFALAHEYGHIYLGHLSQPPSKAHEFQADCYAARVLEDDVVEEAAEFFETNQGDTSADDSHPTGDQRAANIRQCHAQLASRDDDGGGVSGDDDGGTPPVTPPRCHVEIDYRIETTYELQYVIEMEPEMRCGMMMTPMGPRQVCQPTMVPVRVPQEVPVQRRVPYPHQVCD